MRLTPSLHPLAALFPTCGPSHPGGLLEHWAEGTTAAFTSEQRCFDAELSNAQCPAPAGGLLEYWANEATTAFNVDKPTTAAVTALGVDWNENVWTGHMKVRSIEGSYGAGCGRQRGCVEGALAREKHDDGDPVLVVDVWRENMKERSATAAVMAWGVDCDGDV